ncbi:hypothetical protein COT96_01430 [Candidatus Falkowbacteria bacterium CG10_big_fil_rev_8_21_14_0_10_38_22]|uniref:Uncharacterized protein n=2 Tax=Candidatus Falkowiibacteriota TaxID=1752728 RepID=A0A2M6WRJ3_9BACT|nr:hypothetical protein [Candidatus Falkowbacteria bacterium]PIT95384.1 MAG: hypothetical protein COT96_01430 [Candidatus Falkowbacteria bacterium CG10_big_fil_rev_8_21_14_0_10_38_22]
MNKEITEKITKINWEWEWGRRSSALVNYAVLKAWTDSPKEFSGHFNNFIIFIKDSQTDFFISKRDLDSWGKHAYNISTKKGFIEFYERAAQNACRELIELSKLSPKKDIVKQYYDWANAYIQTLYFVAQIRIFNRMGEQKLKEFIKSKIKDRAEQIKIFTQLSATTRQNAFSDFHILMQKAFREKIDGNKGKFNKLVNKIVRNFKWVPVGYSDEPTWTKIDIEKQLQNFKFLKEHKIDKKAIINKLKPNKEILRLIDIIDLFVYYKDYFRRICNYCHYYSRPLFKKLAKKFDLSFKEVKMLLPDELGKKNQKNFVLYFLIKAFYIDLITRKNLKTSYFYMTLSK